MIIISSLAQREVHWKHLRLQVAQWGWVAVFLRYVGFFLFCFFAFEVDGFGLKMSKRRDVGRHNCSAQLWVH